MTGVLVWWRQDNVLKHWINRGWGAVLRAHPDDTPRLVTRELEEWRKDLEEQRRVVAQALRLADNSVFPPRLDAHNAGQTVMVKLYRALAFQVGGRGEARGPCQPLAMRRVVVQGVEGLSGLPVRRLRRPDQERGGGEMRLTSPGVNRPSGPGSGGQTVSGPAQVDLLRSEALAGLLQAHLSRHQLGGCVRPLFVYLR
jgi:hypothetical protein